MHNFVTFQKSKQDVIHLKVVFIVNISFCDHCDEFVLLVYMMGTLCTISEQDQNNFGGETFNLGLSDANLSKLELCMEIKKYIPKFEILESDIGQDIDKRDYIVSNEKIESRGFKPNHSIKDGIEELTKLFKYLIPSASMKNF